MILTREDIKALPRIYRLNLVNSITGIKPANLVGTRSGSGSSNLAIFSSVVHLGSHPALLGLFVRPGDEVPRHSFENILETAHYTINHVPVAHVQPAHQTSAKYDRAVSEFEACGFTERYIRDFPAPFVGESPLKIGMKLLETLPIRANGTTLVIGEVQLVEFAEEAVSEEGYLDLQATGTAGISGLNSYYQVQKIASFPYARPEKE
jgi:flavin reductase (DIM6/NTAB) family NADH-FMN oxidoreductase RutF